MATSPHNFMDNYGRPDFKLPYRWNNDAPLSIPLGPKNVHVTSPYLIGVIDIRWDSPTSYIEHNGYNVLGVNVYRSFDTPEGPYTRINDSPIGALYYRDETREVWADQEDPVAGGRLLAGTNANGDWVVHTYNKPIVIPDTNGDYANHPKHVRVDVRPTSLDDFQTVPAFKVVGETGEIYLNNRKIYNHQFNRLDNPVLPILSSGGEIRVSYTYINNHIQKDANRKVYYKCTTVAVDSSNDEMKETPLNEVEAISLYDMEKIDWIWAESIRRNRWMLEQAGERVKLFIRKWAGEICPCWDIQYRTAKSDCHICFAPGTLINTEHGWRSIEDIKIGEKVLSSDGKYHTVKSVMVNPYEGVMKSITTSVNTNPLIVTPNHPFLVLRGEHKKGLHCGPKCNKYIYSGDGIYKDFKPYQLKSGKWYARIRSKKFNGGKQVYLGVFDSNEEANKAMNNYRENNIKPGHELIWESANNVGVHDWLVPVWDKSIKDIETIRIPERILNGVKDSWKVKGDTEFKVDEEFLWIIGMYIAEGSYSKISNVNSGLIRFTLHKKEIGYQNKIINFFKKYNYNPTISPYKSSNGVTVRVSSFALCEWFREILGHLSHNKHIPIDFMHLPDNKSWAIIRGIYDGDGIKGKNKIVQTSEVLALQMAELLHRLGEQPTIWNHSPKKLTAKGNLRKKFYSVSWASDNLKNANRRNRWVYSDKVLAQVTKCQDISYKGFVYNLEVEEDHTYIANGILTHNCHGTGYVGGYEGPYDYIIAPPETEKTVQLMDMGLHVSYDWQSWGPPYPLLNDRDFIVRQNGDRLSLAHINPQGSRGAIYQQHFMLAPLDRRDPRYTVSINGGLNLPAAWNAFRTQRSVDASPVIPNKPEIPDQYERTGRTVTFENICY